MRQESVKGDSALERENLSRRVLELELVDQASYSFHALHCCDDIIELFSQRDAAKRDSVVVSENLDGFSMFDTMIELGAYSRCQHVIRGDFIGSHVSSLMAWGGRL